VIIRYTPESLDDLERLRSFVKQKNPLAARRIALELQEGVEKLKLFPKIGLSVPNATNPDLVRDLYIGKYTVRYLMSEKQIVILRIWHSKEIEKDL